MNKEFFNNIFTKFKDFWHGMSKKLKIISLTGVFVVLGAAIIVTVVLNNKNAGYKVLYPNMSATEAGSVYQTLVEMGAKPELGNKGEVMVPDKEYDMWILQLSARGYPQSTLTYDVFSSHSGLTTTETEQKQWLIYQLQDRIQDTLKRMSGVSSATVTITMPQNTGYVWQQAESKDKPSAGVLLALKSGVTLNSEQTESIKNLVASSVPQMTKDEVTVVDAKTGLELKTDASAGAVSGVQNLEYEKTVQTQLEENATKILSPKYGSNVRAVAKVTIDYDKMMTEKNELISKPNGNGYTTSEEQNYSVNGQQAAGDIAGEENNTDVPSYNYTKPTQDGGTTDYSSSKKYDYGYIKTQIEKGNATLKKATISVMVQDNNLTDAKREELTALISKGTDIEPESIFISSYNAEETVAQQAPSVNKPFWETSPTWLLITGGVLIAITIFAIIALMTLLRKKKKKPNKPAPAKSADENSDWQRQLEIDEHKKHLEELAKEGRDEKDEAVLHEVQDFAKDNPEIAANLIRSWLKESD